MSWLPHLLYTAHHIALYTGWKHNNHHLDHEQAKLSIFKLNKKMFYFLKNKSLANKKACELFIFTKELAVAMFHQLFKTTAKRSAPFTTL